MKVPRHVAIIMDGNGRWAQARGLPRTAGHKVGLEALRRAVKAARDKSVEVLSVYSFSTENWSRPKAEVALLLALLRRYIRQDVADLHANNVRIKIIGSRIDLQKSLIKLLEDAETVTKDNTGLTLVVAFNYGAKQELVRAVQKLVAANPTEVTEAMIEGQLDTAGLPPVDLLIRTGGEQRISNFLLWQSAYAEFVFMDCYWPEFDASHFAEALERYEHRDRRFGSLKETLS